MTTPVAEHEKLFDEICNKLNELSTHQSENEVIPVQPKYEQMQVQMKKFHSDLVGSQEQLREKIKTLENVSYEPATLDSQLQTLANQLSAERASGAKLSADLAKSLELSLQLQLEIQGLKARAMQMQSEEKKYSQTLFDRCKILQRDLELVQALKEETSMELAKAKNAFSKEQDLWEEQRAQLEAKIQELSQDKLNLEDNVASLNKTVTDRDETITSLNQEIEKISTAFNEVESSATQQHDVLKNLMQVAETKIIEMKLALDKKTLEAQDYYSHLQQAMAQSGIMKQENAALKEYVAKLNYYHQQTQQAQMVVAQMAAAQAQGQPGTNS
jgi:predicted  nucleic acid-binding Zn-ribbon protein